MYFVNQIRYFSVPIQVLSYRSLFRYFLHQFRYFLYRFRYRVTAGFHVFLLYPFRYFLYQFMPSLTAGCAAHRAAQAGNAGVVASLLVPKHRTNWGLRDETGSTPRQLASRGGKVEPFRGRLGSR